MTDRFVNLNRRTQMSDGVGTTIFGYDSVDQLISAIMHDVGPGTQQVAIAATDLATNCL